MAAKHNRSQLLLLWTKHMHVVLISHFKLSLDVSGSMNGPMAYDLFKVYPTSCAMR